MSSFPSEWLVKKVCENYSLNFESATHFQFSQDFAGGNAIEDDGQTVYFGIVSTQSIDMTDYVGRALYDGNVIAFFINRVTQLTLSPPEPSMLVLFTEFGIIQGVLNFSFQGFKIRRK
jgi:hypothetical protein